ncbi:exonuclease SbcCD subunit D C-terminal domain-containing protein [Psychrobacter lutiphocae]|uniref:exonuclease SbcCD subunit D C-terminal domain-containing protein n=1 Tax=Psychrobacter lutiphocae TaxID=540500 RepID=UPI00037C41F1|nr:exonuclease SbcCD subunit D C-terminal domain-containing protein [Psychrobacter lutiphocae]
MSKSIELSTHSKPLTVLHTSDWHLGRRLYGQLRYEEFEAFLAWLEDAISHYQVDILIVAGDIFDTMTPSNRAQSLYYEFLGRVAHSICQHIVIVAGNHDSPTFLDAPANVLKFLNVHVVGTACEDLEDEVLTLSDNEGNPFCIITAVPYLRDRDVRSSRAGESDSDKDSKVIEGIKAHYDGVADIAKARQNELTNQYQYHIPIIATGHLFASGGRTTDDDGVRNLYVGSLGKISADMFADCFDYVALGHLHVPQRVGGREHIRYSGSPIPMGFGEARQQKQVLLIQFGDTIDEHFDDTQPLRSKPNETLSTSTLQTSTSEKSTSETPSKTSVKPKLKNKDNQFIDDLFAGLDDELNESNNEQDKVDKASEEIPNDEIPAEPVNVDSFDIDSFETDSFKTDGTDSPTPVYHDHHKQMQITSIPIPTFQKLMQIKGDMTYIAKSINELPKDAVIWLEVIYEGNEIVSNLNEEIQTLLENTPFKALKIKNTNNYNKVLTSENSTETLQDLNVMEVFERCMTVHEIAESQKDELRDAYQQILHEASQEDVNSGGV